MTEDHELKVTFECANSRDVTGDGMADLADAILILKLLAGANITDAISPCADRGEDSNIGMAELLAILRAIVAEL